jgi:hypothetical protein
MTNYEKGKKMSRLEGKKKVVVGQRTVKQQHQELPASALKTIEELKTRNSSPDRDEYIKMLREAGWTLQSIASAHGMTRERVRQIAAEPRMYFEDVKSLDVPVAPNRTVDVFKSVEIELDPAVAARMLELSVLARKPITNSAEAFEFVALLNQEIERGVSGIRLAKVLGINHSSIYARLARYGYRETKAVSKHMQLNKTLVVAK